MASLLYGLSGKLAGELCSPLFKDYVGKPWELGTKSEFEKIKSSVSAIEAVLLDAEEKQRTNRQVQDWLKKIKRVFYDLEDLLQEVCTEDLKRQVRTKNKKAKKVHIFFSSSNQLKFRFKMGRKVKLNIGNSLPNIVNIKLYGCWRWRHLPALGLLPCLQQLHLETVVHVEYLIDSSSLEEEADHLLFPSLKDLYLKSMWDLKGVVEPTEASQTAAANNSRYFPVLEKLQIEECPLFESLSNEEGKQFVSLLELRLSGMNRKTLPSWVQYLSHLQTLKLHCWLDIVSLPEWMGNLTSLEELYLDYLPSLTSLPDCIQRLTSLQRLDICSCHKLKSRCKKETGVDWHKIAHIPNISVIKYRGW